MASSKFLGGTFSKGVELVTSEAGVGIKSPSGPEPLES